jgi:Uncharacterized conserved protein (DUF2278)/Lamin Tail Domain
LSHRLIFYCVGIEAFQDLFFFHSSSLLFLSIPHKLLRGYESVNDLNEHLDMFIKRAIEQQGATVYAFGGRWGPEEKVQDKIFKFKPGNGIHKIHMNQGNAGKHADENGVWQDGALLLHFPSESQWVGIFLKFQSQSWHTDDETGQRVDVEVERTVRIVAALVNPTGPAPEEETVTLLNVSPNVVNLANWAIADKLKNKQVLSGLIKPGDALKVTLQQPVQLGNNGGAITLLNAQGLKVDGVSYTKEQAQQEGWTVVF